MNSHVLINSRPCTRVLNRRRLTWCPTTPEFCLPQGIVLPYRGVSLCSPPGQKGAGTERSRASTSGNNAGKHEMEAAASPHSWGAGKLVAMQRYLKCFEMDTQCFILEILSPQCKAPPCSKTAASLTCSPRAAGLLCIVFLIPRP